MQISALENVRRSVGLPLNERGPQELEVAAGVHGLSEIELHTFIDMAEARYRAKRMDPGLPLHPSHASVSITNCIWHVWLSPLTSATLLNVGRDIYNAIRRINR